MCNFTVNGRGNVLCKFDFTLKETKNIKQICLYNDNTNYVFNDFVCVNANPYVVHLPNTNFRVLYNWKINDNINRIKIVFEDFTFFDEEFEIDKNFLLSIDNSFVYKSYPYEKPFLLSAFTHCYNDSKYLKLWVDYYGAMLGYENVYVIDHGSTINLKQNIDNKVNFIKIPRSKCDHNNISAFCNYFQRFLLTQYEWVIHNDCDEILFFGKDNDFQNMLSVNQQKNVFVPSNAFNILHLKGEEDINFENFDLSNRTKMEETKHYVKPSLSNTEITWGPGFHRCYENTIEMPGLLLFHLKFLDKNIFLNRNQSIWKQLEQTEIDKRDTPIQASELYTTEKEDVFFEFTNSKTCVELHDWIKFGIEKYLKNE